MIVVPDTRNKRARDHDQENPGQTGRSISHRGQHIGVIPTRAKTHRRHRSPCPGRATPPAKAARDHLPPPNGRHSPPPRRDRGYLLECHGRRTIRRAVDQYELAMALDPAADKVRYQWILAKATLGEPEDAISLYRERAATSPGDVRELRFLSSAYLKARDFAGASEVIGAGLELAPDDWKLICDRGR
jgi:hypothetical protein